MKIVVPVSDKYRYIMPVACELLNKYWPNQEFIVLCFKQPDKLPDNFEIVSLGHDTQWWTVNLRWFFSTFQEEYFSLHLEDFILRDYVKMDKLKIMENEIINGADKAMLHSHMNIFTKPLHDDILEINQNSDYRTSVHPAIWKTEYFSRYLNKKLSASGYETQGGPKNDGAKIVSLKSSNSWYDHIVDFFNLFRRDMVKPYFVGMPHEEDLDIIMKIPLNKKDKANLKNMMRNDCTVCGEDIDVLLLDQAQTRIYTLTGKCFNCQNE